MSGSADLLVEIGTEELPPKALRSLMAAFGAALAAALDEARLAHGDVRAYASPRRLAVFVGALAARQQDRKVSQKGPPVSVAFDDAGALTAAGKAFASKCGVAPADLGRTSNAKGEWLSCDVIERGQAAAELLPALIERCLAELPVPRRMRWGDGDIEFVRPVHWVVLLHGTAVIDATIMGVHTGKTSRGHRFHAAGPVEISAPSAYLDALEQQGHVIADFERRRELVREGVERAAQAVGGSVVANDALYDEVAALVEWPVTVTGSFDPGFLELPREVVVSTLTGHQRYFPVADAEGKLLPAFITVANIDSKNPASVRDGNERVIRPRLADAAFFWDSDRRTTLAERQDALREVVYQRGLGSLHDKSARNATLVAWLADQLATDAAIAQRAAMLCKCDLLTGMVGEFPDLQGTMGRYYAGTDGEPEDVALAIEEHYLPRFAGDRLPESAAGRLLAIADKMDTLAGVFALGKKPSGNRDPFGLRRAALGVVRLLAEAGLEVGLRPLVEAAVAAQPAGKYDAAAVTEDLFGYINDRLKGYFLDSDRDLDAATFDAVMARQPETLPDFERRLKAVQAFLALDAAASLASANKRIANMLRQADEKGAATVREKLLDEPAEQALWAEVQRVEKQLAPLLETGDYTAALAALAELRKPVDSFFDDVMVMAEDAAIRDNRIALLRELRALFLNVADISRLAIA